MRVSILRYPFSGRYVRRTRYSRAASGVPTDVQGESTMDFTSPCAIRYSLTGSKSSSHVLLGLDDESVLGQDASVEGDDTGDFHGIEFLVPIQHEVETGGAERKLQTAASNHRDSAGS